MRTYMQAMANVIDGAEPGEGKALQTAGFNPEFARVYANNSAIALRDALLANFPTVQALIGEKHASHLARLYRADHPLTHRTLVGYGDAFPAFIEAQLPLHALPYLASFAGLDRAWTQAHIAADSQPLVMQDLMDVMDTGATLENHKIALTPDVKITPLDWPVFDIWSKLKQGHEMSESISLEPATENILIWRYDNEVMSRALAPDEYAFLNAIAQGSTLGQALNLALLATPDVDVSTLLPKMVDAKIFQNIEREPHA